MSTQTETAILAGGCFWGVQDLLRRYPGILKTRVGYSGGDVPNATYRNHGDHAEAIEIEFDPAVISYRQILEYFFQIHDPSTRNRQGNDIGRSYRSAIFYASEEQHRVALDTIADVDASGLWPGKVVTEVEPARPRPRPAGPWRRRSARWSPAARRPGPASAPGCCRSRRAPSAPGSGR
jgi:peptide-methionine (S)-S-oxide reductase